MFLLYATLSDGEVMAQDGESLVYEYVNAGPEMPAEEFEPVLGQIKVYSLLCWQNSS